MDVLGPGEGSCAQGVGVGDGVAVGTGDGVPVGVGVGVACCGAVTVNARRVSLALPTASTERTTNT